MEVLLEPPPRAFGAIEVVVIAAAPASLGECVAATAAMLGDLLVLFLQDLRASLKALP